MPQHLERSPACADDVGRTEYRRLNHPPRLKDLTDPLAADEMLRQVVSHFAEPSQVDDSTHTGLVRRLNEILGRANIMLDVIHVAEDIAAAHGMHQIDGSVHAFQCPD